MGSCAGDGFDEELSPGGVTIQHGFAEGSDVAFEKLATTENNVKSYLS